MSEAKIQGVLLYDSIGVLRLYRKYDGMFDFGESIPIPEELFPNYKPGDGAVGVEVILKLSK